MKGKRCVVDDLRRGRMIVKHDTMTCAASRQALCKLWTGWLVTGIGEESCERWRMKNKHMFLTPPKPHFYPWVTKCTENCKSGQGQQRFSSETPESWTDRDMDRSARGSLGCVQVAGPPWGTSQPATEALARWLQKLVCHVKLAWQYQTMGERMSLCGIHAVDIGYCLAVNQHQPRQKRVYDANHLSSCLSVPFLPPCCSAACLALQWIEESLNQEKYPFNSIYLSTFWKNRGLFVLHPLWKCIGINFFWILVTQLTYLLFTCTSCRVQKK